MWSIPGAPPPNVLLRFVSDALSISYRLDNTIEAYGDK